MRRRGFTLIELLVVVAVIALLASVILSRVNTARAKARDVRREADLRSVIVALQLMYDTEGHFPRMSWHISSEPEFLDYLVVHGYLRSHPVDPVNGVDFPNAYLYSYSSFKNAPGGEEGQFYQINYDVEAQPNVVGSPCGLYGTDGIWVTPTHCHMNYPGPLPCSDPYLIQAVVPADCQVLQDANIDM